MIPEKEFIKESIQRTRSTRQWRDQQTLGISSLISELRDVCEEDIPCLYFESLRSNHAFKVPIESLVSSKLSIYNLVKLSFSQFYKLINEKDLLINKQCSLEKSLRACF